MKRFAFALAYVLVALRVSAAELPAVEELLDRYAANQDRINRSYIVKAQTTKQLDMSLSGRSVWYTFARTGKYTMNWVQELRVDGERYKYMNEAWGDYFMGTSTFDERTYCSDLWDGKDRYLYGRSNERPKISVSQYSPVARFGALMDRGFQGGPGFGYLTGDEDRFDRILRNAKTRSVKGSGKFFLLEASTVRGKYQVWFDPEHGYNIAKAVVNRRTGDGWTFVTVEDKCRKNVSISVSAYKKANDAWVPVEISINDDTTWTYGDYLRSTATYKVNDVLLSPDHRALGSFLPNDIPNGTPVAPNSRRQGEYIWQDGHVVPNQNGSAADKKEGLR